MRYEELIQNLCSHAINIIKQSGIKGDKKLYFRPMIRKNNHVNTGHGYIIGRTNLKTGLITIDIFTPKFRKPKAIASILRILAHEIAHHQKPPYRSRYKGRMIIRRHYPIFYRQVKRNIRAFTKDKILKRYFAIRGE